MQSASPPQHKDGLHPPMHRLSFSAALCSPMQQRDVVASWCDGCIGCCWGAQMQQDQRPPFRRTGSSEPELLRASPCSRNAIGGCPMCADVDRTGSRAAACLFSSLSGSSAAQFGHAKRAKFTAGTTCTIAAASASRFWSGTHGGSRAFRASPRHGIS